MVVLQVAVGDISQPVAAEACGSSTAQPLEHRRMKFIHPVN
jgi:hypothetical protein